MSVIDADDYTTVATIDVGTEPLGRRRVAERPLRLRRQRQRQHGAGDRHRRPTPIVATIPVGRSPRALAITNDGDADDLDELLYVPNFFARPRAGFTPPSSAEPRRRRRRRRGLPGGRHGTSRWSARASSTTRARRVVDVVSTARPYQVVDQVVLAPLADTGFNFARGAFVNTTPNDAPRTIFADGGTDGTAGAGRRARSRTCCRASRSSTAAASCPTPPRRPSRRCASTSTCRAWCRCSTSTTNQELTDQTFNLNRGINFDLPAGLLDAQIRDNTERLFPSAPVDIDCSEATGEVLGGEPGQRLHRPHGLRRRRASRRSTRRPRPGRSR